MEILWLAGFKSGFDGKNLICNKRVVLGHIEGDTCLI